MIFKLKDFVTSDYFLFGRQFFYHRIRYGSPISKSSHDKIDRILKNRFEYFKPLSERGKAKFINRLWYIIHQKTFIAKEGMELKIDHKVLLSASIVQVTFGLKKYTLRYFERIFVYPGTFYSNLIRKEVKGLTSGMGNILLSWEDFEKGYEHPSDNYNLGLHELGHALKISFLKDYHLDARFEKHFETWSSQGIRDFKNLKKGNHPLFRPYGGTNRDEFFAVCLETFFESPVEFKLHSPELFNYMCQLLNQDPSNLYNDYKLK